ncbi:hypothetical protein BH09BAC6_BH09BAC6_10820 [soil metagenome]
MAGKKLTISGKVRTSTILEVVISLIIIVVVFGIAMMIYSNVLRFSLPLKKIKAQAILADISVSVTAEQHAENSSRTFTVDDFRIEQELKPYNDDSHLTAIYLTAYDTNQQKIAELRTVIVNSNE